MTVFEYLRVTGEVSIKPCGPEVVGKRGNYIMIIGPTGSGKSSFIEALAGRNNSLGISKDQLAGYTQDVQAYKLQNAAYVFGLLSGQVACYLLDTPGFSDSKISELEVLHKAKEWMVVHRVRVLDHILFLCPITDTRIPGSKRRTIKMMHALLGPHVANQCTIVTTMWDSINSPQAKQRAESHFAQLKDDIWKELTDNGANVTRFENTQLSALQIIDDATSKNIHVLFCRNPITEEQKVAEFLYQELLDRIEGAKRAKQLWRSERLQLYAVPNEELESIIAIQLKEAKQDLEKFLAQLIAFGTAPPGFDGMPERVVYQDLQDHIKEAQEDIQALRLALLRLKTHENPELELALEVQINEAELRLEDSTKKLEEHRSTPPARTHVSMQDRIEQGFKSWKKKFGSWNSKH